jgi:hypothetical protein
MAKKKKQPTNQFHVLLDLHALNADPTFQEKLVAAIQKMAPQSPLWANQSIQNEVANLVKLQGTYMGARQAAGQSAKQHALDVTAEELAMLAVNRSLGLLRKLIENNAVSESDITSMALVAYQGRPPASPLVPPDLIDVKQGKKGSGKATASVHELGQTRRRYAAQWSPSTATPPSWQDLDGSGKSRKLAGAPGTQVLVRFALERGQNRSEWSASVVVTFP